tara:strand:- start:2463 stop:3350 length:888 start_codon:yes stop_codon:yes gene_type:complete
MSNVFYLCEKFTTERKKDSILFFHVPKSAGTTFSVIFSWLFKNQTRIKGPLFKNNDKGGKTAFDLFNQCPSFNFYNKFDFIYGHLPFEIYSDLKKPFLTVSLIRNPIERSLSHYNWMLNRGYCSKYDDLQSLFNNNKITKNTITNQFSGKGFKKKNSDNDLSLAYQNLSTKINLLYKSDDILFLIKKIISDYNLPNIIFQNQQESVYTEEFKNKINMRVLTENNKMDMELYDMLLKNDIFKQKKDVLNNRLESNNFFFSSPKIKISGKNNKLLNKDEFNELENNLYKNKFKIIKV